MLQHDIVLRPLRSYEATTAPGEACGEVSYTHAGGIDRPLVITKNGVSVIPHQNSRGMFALGTNPAGGRDVPDIDWPGFHTTPWHGDTRVVENWFGSLATEMRDATGQIYRRNRYYDPASGQFTQPDPIGLAGGLNSYGFAEGDPVTYRDPYGLWVEFHNDEARALWNEMKARVEEGLASDDPRVRKGARVLNSYIQSAENDALSMFYIEVADIDDDYGGGRENDMEGGYWSAHRIQVDRDQPAHSPGASWIVLAHETGGAVARSLMGIHAWGAIRAENAARRIAGCPIRRAEGSTVFSRCEAP